MSLLKRLRKGSVDEVKAAKLSLEKNKIDENVLLMIDEMYLHKSAQNSWGDFIGCNTVRNLYKGFIVLTIKGIKKSIPIVIKECPELSLNGH